MKLKHVAVLLIMFIAILLCACSMKDKAELKDGYYTAETASFDEHGWKEYVTIYVSGNRIVTVEYNAKNPSGLIKSWDMQYMRDMNAAKNTYPTKYTREYADMLLRSQDADKLDAVSGATHSSVSFKLLAKAVLQNAREGNKEVVFVEIPRAADTESDHRK